MEMPDLPPSEKRSEERKQLKFWIEQCHRFEQQILELKEDIATLESQKLTAEALLHHWFPEVMASRSESYFAAGWLVDLDKKLPEMDQDIHDAAMLLGEIPTHWNRDSEPESAERRIYP
jgi:Asp-tRNA(Asn)/Glu-tRNA(Gln) amidotransferase B subunit